MVRMVVLSDSLAIPDLALAVLFGDNVDIFSWGKCPQIPRPSDYEIVLLDLKISKGLHSSAFMGLRQEICTLLEAGGVVICLNYFTVSTNQSIAYDENNSHLKRKDIIRAGRDTRFETNYDWVPEERLLSQLGIAQNDAQIGKKYDLKTQNKLFTEYLSGVPEYHKTVSNVQIARETTRANS